MRDGSQLMRMAMVISSYVDDTPGLQNNGQLMRLLDVAILPAGFHPDLYIDSDPTPAIPGQRECIELRLAQPPFWLDRRTYGRAHGYGFEDWNQKFGSFVQVLYETEPNKRPYPHPSTPLPEAPVSWNTPIYARWDWSPAAYETSLALEPDSFIHSGYLADWMLRERLREAHRDLHTVARTNRWHLEHSGGNSILRTFGGQGSNQILGTASIPMSDWLTAFWADSIESGGCVVAISGQNSVHIADKWMQCNVRLLFQPSQDFVEAVNHHRSFGRVSVGLRFNVLASREVVVTEMVLMDERTDHRFDGNPPFLWIGSNDAGKPLPHYARYLSM